MVVFLAESTLTPRVSFTAVKISPPDLSQPKFASAWDYLQSLPPLKRSPEEWAEIERELREEKDAWER